MPDLTLRRAARAHLGETVPGHRHKVAGGRAAPRGTRDTPFGPTLPPEPRPPGTPWRPRP